MNLSLTLWHVFLSFCMKSADTRASLMLDHGFGTFNLSQKQKVTADRFRQFLKREGFSAAPKIIQQNLGRRRIIFLQDLGGATGPSKRLVVKWIDLVQLGCFNFVSMIDNERMFHFDYAPLFPGLIPKGSRCGEDFIAVEAFDGVTLYQLMSQGQHSVIEAAMQVVLNELGRFYRQTTKGEFSPIDFNALLMREYRYGTQIQGSTGMTGLLSALNAPYRLTEIHRSLMSDLLTAFTDVRGMLPASMTVRDIDEHNLLYSSERTELRLVDWEDAGRGLYIFDVAYFCSRLVALVIAFEGERRLCESIISIGAGFVASIDSKHMGIYRLMLAWQLLYIMVNPWLWPSESTWQLSREGFGIRLRKLRIVRNIMEGILYQSIKKR